jgi:hypothetical protein
MGMGDKEKFNPLRLIGVRVPVSFFDLPHPLVHTAVDGKPVPLGFYDITGPRDRPRRPHEFDFHESDLLPCFSLFASFAIISGLGDLIKGDALSLSNLLRPLKIKLCAKW